MPMPTYAYLCKNCGHEFDKFESITASPTKACPACKKETAERKICSGGGLVFKGPGFYTTDYRKDSKPISEKEK